MTSITGFLFGKALLILFLIGGFSLIRVKSKRRNFQYLSAAVIYALTAAFVLHIFMLKGEFADDHEKYGFNKIVTYTAYRPWAYRVLTPTLINIGSSFVSQQYIDSVSKWLLSESPLLKYSRLERLSDARLAFKYHLNFVYLFFCLVALLYAMRYLTKHMYEIPSLIADFAPAVGLLLLPVTFIHGGYFYDFPEYLFMGICLICLIRQNYVIYYIAFVAAVLNKESNALLFFYFLAFYKGNLFSRNFSKHLLIHGLIGGTLLIWIRHIFATNPGSPIENHLAENIAFWSSPGSYFLFSDSLKLGVPIFPNGGNVLTISFVSFFIFYKWREKPLPIRRLFVYMSLILFPVCFYGAYKDEIRDFSLLFPSIYLLGVYSAYSLINRKGRSRPYCVSV